MNLLKYISLSFVALSVAFVSCGDDDPASSVIVIPDTPVTPDDTPDTPSDGLYSELYRPQIHYTPAKNWVNDPNGMVYVDGTWHLFYQYNPYGNDWGNMSWGHATSLDLIHWKEQPVALYKDHLGDIFSGSAVVDRGNTAGFGANAVVALYTSSGDHQQQSLAFSTDGCKTFTTYSGNPIIGNTTRGDFRDPKVFWHEASQRWVMSLALGWQYGIEFWTSTNLTDWKYASTFQTPVSLCNKGQWECPDLVCLDYEGGKKWVLIVNLNPGGPKGGSGIMCFIGDFDGTTFTADDLDYPMWMDFGMDNYAGVTWSNAPDGRTILLGWMNNWMYSGNVPCSPWRSAFTLPRELSLVNHNGKPYIASRVVKEIDQIAGQWQEIKEGSVGSPAAYHLKATLSLDQNVSLVLSNGKGQRYEITSNSIYKMISVKRTFATGVEIPSFSIPSVDGKIRSGENSVELDIYVDQSSVEIFSADGTMAMTNLAFPSSIYNLVSTTGTVTDLKFRTLDSIWR